MWVIREFVFPETRNSVPFLVDTSHFMGWRRAHMRTRDIDHEELLYVLKYNPVTGHFIWKNHPYKNIRGKRAGWRESTGYRIVSLHRVKAFEHRLAWYYMTSEWPKDQIDHINGIRDDNRWCNLREATVAQNNASKKIRKNNESGMTGVFYNRNRWVAQITVNREKIILGRFETFEEARDARVAAEKVYQKDFAWSHNNPQEITQNPGFQVVPKRRRKNKKQFPW